MKFVKNTVDRFIHPKNKIDSRDLVRNRTVVALNLLCILVFAVLISFVLSNPTPLFYIGFVALIFSLISLRLSGKTILSTIIGMGLLHAINIDYFAAHFLKQGLLNIQILWAMACLVVSPLLGGLRLGLFSLAVVLFFFNFIVLNGLSSLPIEMEASARNNLIEFNLVTMVVSGGTLLFEYFLIQQVIKTNEALKELQIQRENTLQSAKLAALGEMAGGIAHEINNPIAIIGGYADIISKCLRKNDLDEKREFLITKTEKISKTVTRISQIIEIMRKLSRDHSDEKWSKTDFRQIVDEVCMILGAKIENRGYTLDVGIPPGTFINCDPIAVSQILINLFNNAVDALDQYQLSESWIRIDLKESNDDFLRFLITNSGPKIPEDIAEKIMNPFFTTKEIGEGTGLGLSFSRKIAKTHHGSLELDADCAHTCFVLTLPKYEASPEAIHITA